MPPIPKPPDEGEFAPDDAGKPDIPVKDWIPERPFDSADYLDRPYPLYGTDADDAPTPEPKPKP